MARPEADQPNKVPSTVHSESSPNWDHGVMSGISSGFKATREALENHPYIDAAATGAIALGLVALKGGKAFAEIGKVIGKTTETGEAILPRVSLAEKAPMIQLGGPMPTEVAALVKKSGAVFKHIEVVPAQGPTAADLEDSIIRHESLHPLKPGDVPSGVLQNPGGPNDFRHALDWGGPTFWTDADHQAIADLARGKPSLDGTVQFISLGGGITKDEMNTYLANIKQPGVKILHFDGKLPTPSDADHELMLCPDAFKEPGPLPIMKYSESTGPAPKPLDFSIDWDVPPRRLDLNGRHTPDIAGHSAPLKPTGLGNVSSEK